MYLVQWHPLARKLEERDYREMRAKYQKEHARKFRLVLQDIRFFHDLISDLNWPLQLILLLLAL